ncbi:MAG TPA: OmpA family protein [Flavisolibacter sp.]|nr:OmpA family protein [Flavisolibacter sp.]
MKKLIALAAIVLIPFVMQAQLGRLMDRTRNKVQQRADNKTDKAIDKVLDEAEGKNTAAQTAPPPQQPVAAPVSQESATDQVISYSKFDFVPGAKVIYAEDFAQDEIGELPLNWNTGGKAELVTINSFKGKWLRLYQNALYLSSNTDTFSRNFTIEFDVILQLDRTIGYSYPYFSFGFFSSNGKAPNDNEFLSSGYRKYSSAEIFTRLSTGGSTGTYVETHDEGKRFFVSEVQGLPGLEKTYNKITHISIQVQGKRMRVWFNDEKKFDLPMAVGQSSIMNQIFFKVHSSSYKDDQLGFYIGNLKVATGKPDARHKLVEEGKFSTTGILFDHQSAVIKPESFGVIREVANVLNEHGSIRIKVLGHTSSDGDDNANMELSRQRATAVKAALEKEFGIEGTRIETEGRGETQPVGDNKTKEGKAQNRRVEFVKLQ